MPLGNVANARQRPGDLLLPEKDPTRFEVRGIYRIPSGAYNLINYGDMQHEMPEVRLDPDGRTQLQVLQRSGR